jgi:GT2 family glycosyltransferase
MIMDNKKPKISVLMSTYNNEDTIQESIRSILNQTYRNFELLIMNDASTDNTLEACNSIEDERIKIYNNKTNLGLTKSLNLLAYKARGKYFARQDADDTSLRQRFENQIKVMEEQNLDIVCSKAFVKNSQRKIPKYKNFVNYKFIYKFTNPFIHGTFFMDKSIFFQIGGYDEDFIFSQDYKFMYDAIKQKAKIKIIKTPLYILNTENNISTNEKVRQQFFANHVKNQTIPNF